MNQSYPYIEPSSEEIRKHIELARERLDSSRVLFKEVSYRDAVSRAYYAFFDAASALLLTEGKVAKTHSGLITIFGLDFVKTGKIKPEFGRLFRRAKEAREEADYEVYREFSQEEVEEIIETAERFVKEIEEQIK